MTIFLVGLNAVFLELTMSVCHSLLHFGSDWNISTATWWIALHFVQTFMRQTFIPWGWLLLPRHNKVDIWLTRLKLFKGLPWNIVFFPSLYSYKISYHPVASCFFYLSSLNTFLSADLKCTSFRGDRFRSTWLLQHYWIIQQCDASRKTSCFTFIHYPNFKHVFPLISIFSLLICRFNLIPVYSTWCAL